ncbi:bifunctional folylpolyglutamate synthase/dihydrofolate synthase [Lactobacillus crispatus]|uniref:bifunctional folylpolyglutamate synthase/dihydrofolate synthase n=1 Tax=Lactobacillus crispatus TaxID=47770 RepID=UPI00105B98E3|nr:folylpolyglutamate synthase/dihydrofolate synthase family protein [Lactobacillus crispatus]TDM88178.1 bifunctional folylpolyglutamate synthase/dihydrofolate synthase [Lactobacillus crispatus]TDM96523.1 bifunctional folylpolyglutamate synthase/dihydrofolate synthase [Lactobacillus crispatus]TDN34207.1 bifunctional folylpolyglutamate synthase/dihydrofolate synthase [Lactobacillus crispatus]
MKFTKAQEVIDYLYALPHLHPKNNLSFIKRLLLELGNPQDLVKTIHITGTNGKGSTSYYLSNLLKKAGQKTGLFVSPYVYEFNERIQLNNQNISDQDLVKTANIVQGTYEKLQQQDSTFSLVTFEYEVALAFVYFAQKKCDYAVIEVGIGGEHDKTNVIMPEVSVITTIGLDHEKIIGPTIQDIAREKSGIIKAKRPVVLGNVPEVVWPILKSKAEEEHAIVYQLGRDFSVLLDNQIVYQDHKRKLVFALRPQVEAYDIAVACQAFFLLKLPLSNEEVETAINQTIIPGRYQILRENPLIILDGAHNIQAMSNLLAVVHRMTQQKHGKLYALVTMMKDKDLEQVFSLFDDKDEVLLTTLSYPRVAKKDDFPIDVQKRYNYEKDYRAAFTQLRDHLGANDILIVSGSFYLVSAILTWKGKRDARTRAR